MSSKGLLYQSTNQQSPLADFRTVVFHPDPVDNGLYVPNRVPRLQDSLVREFGRMTYPEVAYHVLRAWFPRKEISDRELESMVNRTYTWPIPVNPMGNDFYGDMSKGPSLSFKDNGTHGSAMFIEFYHQRETDGTLLDVDSTSGDTGGSASKALYRKPNVLVFIFFPVDNVTEFQRRQMTTLGENIHAIGVKNGDFDACQSLREYCLGNADPELSRYTRTTSNSKSWARFLSQVPHHFYIAAQVIEQTKEKRVNEWIGFGNGGNFGSAQYAKLMGAPIHILGAISNQNAVFPTFINTGVYRPIRTKKSPSEAMDVGNPSGIQRIAHLGGGRIDRDGVVHKMPDLETMRKGIRSTSVSNEMTRETIIDSHRYGVVLDPHGAVARAGMLEFKGDPEVAGHPNVFLETADSVKFPDLIREALGIEPQLPEHMKDIYRLKERLYVIEPDVRQARELILDITHSKR